MFNNRILIVHSEVAAATELQASLENGGFDVRTTLSVKDVDALARLFRPALVIVDLDLLAGDGFTLCRNLRNNWITKDIRILMLSSGEGHEDEVMGLDQGADDFLAKPFELSHLMQRIQILLKRKSIHKHAPVLIRRDGLELDFNRRIASLDGLNLELTATQFSILWTMAERPGFAFERNELVEQSRGCDANSSERTIDAHIRAIRRKLGKLDRLVQTVRGVGYCFPDEGPQVTHEQDAAVETIDDELAMARAAFPLLEYPPLVLAAR